MKKEYTSRGFSIRNFKDCNGDSCSIQASSIATKDMIWLGLDEGTHVDGNCLSRMHIDKPLAKKLIKVLQKFVDTGDL
jgi:hypothetical protein